MYLRHCMTGASMAHDIDTITRPVIKDQIKVERRRLHKVILLNDDSPRASL
jgi:hypothetical protein